MAVTVTASPSYPAPGQRVLLIGTADVGNDDATEWELTSVPRDSRLALGKLLERHPIVVRVQGVPLALQAEDETTGAAARILRGRGSFVADGIVEGMLVDITGASSANDRRVTVARVEPSALTLSDSDTLTTETVSATLTGAPWGRAGGASNVFVPDVCGEYTFAAYELFSWSGTGGAYEGDPLAAPQRRLLSKTTATIHVGAYLDMPIEPVSGHGSTLRILVVDTGGGRSVVRAAELIEPRTDLARVAALDATVSAAVQALVGVAINDIDVAFVSDVNLLASAFEAHRILTAGSVHASADTTNALLRETANSVPAAIERLNDMAAKITAHQQATTSGGTWHAADDGRYTLQVAPRATTLAQAVVLKADLRERVYENHRTLTVSPASHGAADNTNFMNSPEALPAAIVAYLNFVAETNPSIPAGEAEGVGDAIASWGFSRA